MEGRRKENLKSRPPLFVATVIMSGNRNVQRELLLIRNTGRRAQSASAMQAGLGRIEPVATYLPRWLRGSNGRQESLVSCPKCLTIETLWFWRDRLEPTKRFTQESDGRVYHDCGSQLPCQLFTAAYRDGGLSKGWMNDVSEI